MHLDSRDREPFLVRVLTFARDLTIAGFPPNIGCDDNMKEKVQHVCWKCSQVLFAHDLRQNRGKHSLISTGKTLTQDKLADCKVYHMTVPCVIANINSVGGAEASQGPGTTVWTFLEGQSGHNLLCIPQSPTLLLEDHLWETGGRHGTEL